MSYRIASALLLAGLTALLLTMLPSGARAQQPKSWDGVWVLYTYSADAPGRQVPVGVLKFGPPADGKVPATLVTSAPEFAQFQVADGAGKVDGTTLTLALQEKGGDSAVFLVTVPAGPKDEKKEDKGDKKEEKGDKKEEKKKDKEDKKAGPAARADNLFGTVTRNGQIALVRLDRPAQAVPDLKPGLDKGEEAFRRAVLEKDFQRQARRYDDVISDYPSESIALWAQRGLVLNALERGEAGADAVQKLLDTYVAALEPYGRAAVLDAEAEVAHLLAKQADRPEMTAMAGKLVEKARAALKDTDPDAIRLRVLRTATVVTPDKMTGENKSALSALLAKADEQYLAALAREVNVSAREPFKLATPPGRVQVVEFFTSSESRPARPAELTYGLLRKSFGTDQVLFLEYHQPTGRNPDPLQNHVSQSRSEMYKAYGTSLFVNGTREKGLPTDVAGIGTAYAALQQGLQTRVFQTASAPELKLTTKATDGGFEITAEVGKFDAAEDYRLRVLVVEDQVRYFGASGVRLHYDVVRDALPDGKLEGSSLKKEGGKTALTWSAKDTKGRLEKALAPEKNRLPDDRAQDLEKMRVVAVIQNTKTNEIVQAATAELISPKKEEKKDERKDEKK